jgi:hypothetical protein
MTLLLSTDPLVVLHHRSQELPAKVPALPALVDRKTLPDLPVLEGQWVLYRASAH